MPPKAAAGKAQAAKAVNKKKAAEARDQDDSASEEGDEVDEDENKETGEDDVEEQDDVEMKDEGDEEEEGDANDDQEPEDDADNVKAGTKRKAHPTNGVDAPAKKQHQNGDGTKSETNKSATSKQMLNFLMSKGALPLCFPKDELDAARSGDFDKSYSLTPPNKFTPFEHLVTAVLLSKPLSHTLGMRSIRTLLNKPYEFSTPGTMHKAGEDKIWQALEKARTQHRQKTAKQLFDLAESYKDQSKDTDEGDAGDSEEIYELAVQANEGGSSATINYVKESINGMGDVGAAIFCRRVQACDGWGQALWPFADQKSLDSVRECGIDIKDADDLEDMIERDLSWDKVGSMGLNDEKNAVREQDGEVQVAVEFVTLLERAIGCVLEGNVEELKKQAAEKA